MPFEFQKNQIPLYFAIISVFLLPFHIIGNSLFTIFLGLSVVFFYFKEAKFKNLFLSFHFFAILLFVVFLLSVYMSENKSLAWKSLEQKTVFIMLPMIFWMIGNRKIYWIKPLFTSFIISNFIAISVSFIHSFFRFVEQGDINTLTHSSLTSLINLQSTYLALYLLISILILYLSYEYHIISYKIFSQKVIFFLIIYFSLSIILLASRILYLPLFIIHLYMAIKWLKKSKWSLLFYTAFPIFFILLLMAKIPLFNTRIMEMKNTDFSILNMKKFNYDTPINGLSMRLLFTKFGLEVLQENKSFLWGAGIGEAQNMQHCKFVEYNFYMGNPLTNDTGYLNYNYHNQYLQILVQTGLVGLFLFLLLFVSLFSKKNKLLNLILLCYLLLFLTESSLERQNGISHILFFCSLLFNTNLKHLKIAERSVSKNIEP